MLLFFFSKIICPLVQWIHLKIDWQRNGMCFIYICHLLQIILIKPTFIYLFFSFVGWWGLDNRYHKNWYLRLTSLLAYLWMHLNDSLFQNSSDYCFFKCNTFSFLFLCTVSPAGVKFSNWSWLDSYLVLNYNF